MIVIDETSAIHICYLVDRICDDLATKEEIDEFMLLMYDSQSIPQYAYDCYKDGSNVPWAISVAETSIKMALLDYLNKHENEHAEGKDDVKPAA